MEDFVFSNENEIVLCIYPQDFESWATATLEGILFGAGWNLSKSIHLIFLTTDLSYRTCNNGPDLTIVCEYTFGCLAESIVSLMNKGAKIKISTEMIPKSEIDLRLPYTIERKYK